MKAYRSIIVILILASNSCLGQRVSSNDSLKIILLAEKVFKILDSKNKIEFGRLATRKFYCILCDGTVNSKYGPYIIKRENFIDTYLPSILMLESYQRAKVSKKYILIPENDYRSDVTLLITVWQKDEIAKGHEGGQFGLYFKRKGDNFKFAGVETIP